MDTAGQSKAYNELTSDQKAEIRKETAKAIRAKATDEALTRMRVDLAQKYNANPKSVESVGAYVRYYATRVLSKAGLGTVPSDALVIAWADLSEKTGDTNTIAAEWNTSAGVEITGERIAELVEAYQKKVDGYRNATKKKVKSTIESSDNKEPTSKAALEDSTVLSTKSDAEPTSSSVQKITAHPKGGAWADYEHSAIKETWRISEGKFIDTHVDKNPEVRRNMRILCNPGIKCYLEIRHLLALGFTPKNIIAVERERKGWGDFERNAREIGVTPLFGEIKDVAQELNGLIDIALIDFVSGGSDQNMLTLQSLPLSRKAILAINVMAKREKTEFQERMGRLHKSAISSGNAIGREYLERKVAELNDGGHIENLEIMDRAKLLTELVNEAIDKREDHLSSDNDMSWEERETMLWYMARYAGIYRPESKITPNLFSQVSPQPHHFADPENTTKYTEEQHQQSYAYTSFKEIQDFCTTWAAQMAMIDKDPRLFKLQRLSNLLNCIVFGRRQIVALQKYSYKSKIGKTPSPFMTNIAVTELPKEEYRKYQPVAHFALTYAIASLTGGRLAPNSGAHKVFRGGSPYKYISLTVEKDGRKITSISMETLMAAMDDFDKIEQGYPLSSWEGQNAVPRISLEDVTESGSDKDDWDTLRNELLQG